MKYVKMDKKRKREILEWIILIGVIGIIYLGGWQTQVIGKLQQAVLATGIISPDEVSENLLASYDFNLLDQDGKDVPFDSFEGQVVFLNFWATWCPPCVAEMPDINSLYDEKSDSVSFVMISLDKDRNKAMEYVAANEFDFPIYFLNSSLPTTYNVRSIPTTYVLSKEGKVKIANHGMAKYNSKSFKSLLSKLQ